MFNQGIPILTVPEWAIDENAVIALTGSWCRESVSARLHFANDIRDSLALGLLVVVRLSRKSAY